MDRSWLINGGICAAAFGGALLLLVPSTETKASWTSVHHTVTPFVSSPVDQGAATDMTYPVALNLPPEPFRREPVEEEQASRREIAIAEADQAYSDGYAWAADHEAESARTCRRLAGPRREGCRDYVASLEPEEPYGDYKRRDEDKRAEDPTL